MNKLGITVQLKAIKLTKTDLSELDQYGHKDHLKIIDID